MKIALSIVFVVIAWWVGVFGWSQIVGSIQHAASRGTKMTAITIAIWVLILGAITALVYFVFNRYLVWFAVGLGLSLIRILFAGEIR